MVNFEFKDGWEGYFGAIDGWEGYFGVNRWMDGNVIPFSIFREYFIPLFIYLLIMDQYI